MPKPEETSENENLWIKCSGCDQIIYKKELFENSKICPKCGHYQRMNAYERVDLLADKGEDGKPLFEEFDDEMTSQDPLAFYDSSEASFTTEAAQANVRAVPSYLEKLEAEKKKTKTNEAAVCGEARIGGHRVAMAILNFEFMGGSMGSVVGEKFTRAMEYAYDEKIPLIMLSSSGGARMQEGVLSLMQMAKTSAALARLHEASIFTMSVLCDPTTGGVTASFAMLGDILIAEPKALIAFAGPRVIEQTIRQKLPEGFQQSEFLLKHGMIDCIVERKNMKQKISSLLDFFAPRAGSSAPAA